MHWKFHDFSRLFAKWMGSPYAFIAACTIVVGWLLSGPLFAYSDTWQLVINTGTTIVTFLMVFIIQNTQNRDARAMHLKLDELICAVTEARLELVDAEDLRDEELDLFQKEFSRRRKQAEADRQANARE